VSNQVFDFCDDARVIEEIPPEEQTVTSMNGWDFSAKPKVPYRREFAVKLYGLIWYLNATGAYLDEATDTKHNVGKLLKFYRDHRMWDSFLINHEYLGQIRVRFNKPLRIPAGIPNAGGKLDELEVSLIEHSPTYNTITAPLNLHRYWRIYSRLNGGNSGTTAIYELQLRTAVGGTTVTGSGGATSSAGTAANAFDGNTATACNLTNAVGQWLKYDFGAGNERDIVEIAAVCDSSSGTNLNEFDIQWSDDGSTWTTAWSVSKPTGWTAGTTYVFTKPDAVASRYWRVRGFTAVGSGAEYVSEMEMRSAIGGADQCSGGTAIARGWFSTYVPANAFDNNFSTFYIGNAVGSESAWLGYDFGSGVTKSILQVSYTTEPAGGGSYNNSPSSGVVESSPDKISWLPRIPFSGLTWTSGSTNLIS
jgi:hypothetical protein